MPKSEFLKRRNLTIFLPYHACMKNLNLYWVDLLREVVASHVQIFLIAYFFENDMMIFYHHLEKDVHKVRKEKHK